METRGGWQNVDTQVGGAVVKFGYHPGAVAVRVQQKRFPLPSLQQTLADTRLCLSMPILSK